MPQNTQRVLVAWLILGPLLGAAISFVADDALGEEIILATTGGLFAGLLYSRIGPGDGFLVVLCVVAGAATLLLIDDLVDAFLGLELGMRVAVASFGVAMAASLTWFVRWMAEAGRLDLGLAGIVIRDEEPIRFWALVAGTVGVGGLLMLLAAALLAGGEIAS
jgi:hypothetical protein